MKGLPSKDISDSMGHLRRHEMSSKLKKGIVHKEYQKVIYIKDSKNFRNLHNLIPSDVQCV